MSEVDHEENAVDQGVAKGNQSIHTAQDDTGDRKAEPRVRAVELLSEDDGPQSPQDD
ncbi:MAG: hypothetical protein U5K32_08425 [Bacteroidales bacterium]|nr:hypothetical protein [Bacteroidales bacterium]